MELAANQTGVPNFCRTMLCPSLKKTVQHLLYRLQLSIGISLAVITSADASEVCLPPTGGYPCLTEHSPPPAFGGEVNSRDTSVHFSYRSDVDKKGDYKLRRYFCIVNQYKDPLWVIWKDADIQRIWPHQLPSGCPHETGQDFSISSSFQLYSRSMIKYTQAEIKQPATIYLEKSELNDKKNGSKTESTPVFRSYIRTYYRDEKQGVVPVSLDIYSSYYKKGQNISYTILRQPDIIRVALAQLPTVLNADEISRVKKQLASQGIESEIAPLRKIVSSKQKIPFGGNVDMLIINETKGRQKISFQIGAEKGFSSRSSLVALIDNRGFLITTGKSSIIIPKK